MVFKKEVEKRLRGTRSIKNAPPGGPQMNSRPFCGLCQTSENVVFCELRRFRLYARILHSSAVLGRTSPTKYSQGFFWTPKGWPKNREKPGFFGCLMCVFFFPIRLLMVTCRLDIPSCLQMFHSSLHSYFCCYVVPSLRWLCFLVSIHLYLCCALYFSFSCFSLLSSLLVWQKPRSNHKISQILIVIFCFGACIPTLSLGPDNNPTRPREEPSKNVVFCCLACLVY